MSGKIIEVVINEKLVGKIQKNALELVTFMQDQGISFEGFDDGSNIRWTPTYRGRGIGCVAVAEELMLSAGVSFALWLGLDCEFENECTADNELQEFVTAHVVNCPQGLCKPPYCENNRNSWTIFGREYESTCHAPLAFFTLDDDVLENIKKLVLLIK